jgi:hypothetical protein
MAILKTCSCGATFGTSASSAKWKCDDCDGTIARKRAEEERWSSLTADQKADELRRRVEALEQRSHWDGRIG